MRKICLIMMVASPANIINLHHGLARIPTDRSIFRLSGESVKSAASLSFRLCRFFLADSFTYFEGHLAGLLVGVDDDMIAVKDLAIEDLHRQRILHQLLDRALQRTRTKVRIVALREEQVFGRVRELERDLAIGQQPPHIFEAQLDDLDQLILAERAEDDDVVDSV